jgi:hypothetical protein
MPHIASVHYTFQQNEKYSPIQQAGDISLCLFYIQNGREVVIAVNPNVTEFNSSDVEITAPPEGVKFLIYDIHQKQTQQIIVDRVTYRIDFLTWSKPSPDVLKVDFEVEKVVATEEA